MQKLKTLAIATFTLFFGPLLMGSLISNAYGSYYDTLPKGVRLFAFRQVSTGKVRSSYGSDSTEMDYHLRQDFSSDVLKDINPAAEAYFNELKDISPEAYDAFSFGEYEGSGQGKVDVQGFGMGYGITDRLTAYASIAYYRGRVDFQINRTQGNNIEEVVRILSEHADKSESASLMAQLTSQLPDANEQLLQSIVVNFYGYEPMGSWEGKGFGDMEIGMIYRLTDWEKSGLALSAGVTLPTGRVENPNILQDISFGDGQTDLWLEFGGGVQLAKRKLELDANVRYTHQLPSEKNLRVPESSEFPLSARLGTFEEKLGDIWEAQVKSLWWFNDWFRSYLTLNHFYKEKNEYKSEFSRANTILRENSDTMVQTVRAGVNLTSTRLFLQNKFAIPLSLDLSAQTMVSGRNIPKYHRFDMEIRFFF